MRTLEQRNRLIIAATVIVMIIGALIASFGRGWISTSLPQVELPSVDTTSSAGPESSSPGQAGDYQPVSVTPETVQAVIATLSRSGSYYRELTVESFWTGGSSTTSVSVWTDGGWSHTRQTLPSGAVRHDLVGDGTLYYWYDGSSLYHSAPADDLSSDLSQRIPTYETVLNLPPETISAAGYEQKENIPCVYAEITAPDTGRVERYWVSVESGLLVCAEAEEGGETVYRMTSWAPPTTPCPSTASFSLPDGTELHSLEP